MNRPGLSCAAVFLQAPNVFILKKQAPKGISELGPVRASLVPRTMDHPADTAATPPAPPPTFRRATFGLIGALACQDTAATTAVVHTVSLGRLWACRKFAS
jgi:hypothetical protein